MSTHKTATHETDTNGELARGTLAFGLRHEGRRHRDFTMRLPTLADNLAAIQAYPEGSSVQHEIVMFARCMQTLGDIPKDAITYELLANGLMPVEYEVINDALGEVKKKLLDSLANFSPGGS